MAKTAYVYVHGFLGAPSQFDTLRTFLGRPAEDEYALILPGHGGTLFDFVQSRAEDWQNHIDKTLDHLRLRYDRLVLVGHSMGGPLLIRSALKNPANITSIAAVSLPLRIGLTFRAVRTRLASLHPARRNEDQAISAIRALCGVSGIRAGSAWRLLPNTIALLKIVSSTRKALPGLAVPLTAVISENDEIVSPRSAQVVQKALPGTKVVLLQKASHFWFPQEEVAQIAQAIQT